MRIRFFAVILTVLLVVGISAAYLHAIFVQADRLKFIDQQIREASLALLDSSLSDIRKVDFETVDSIISEELGENRIGKFFIIRNDLGETLYKSTSARVLPLDDIAQAPQWLTIKGNKQYIRVLNLRLPRIPDRTMQIGFVIEDSLVRPTVLATSNFVFIAILIAVGLVVAWILTSTLLSPIRKLEKFVSGIARGERASAELPLIPNELKFDRRGKNLGKDEFARLIAGMEELIDRVNRGYRLSRIWVYQMAHELKTPASIIAVELEKGLATNRLAPDIAATCNVEIKKIGETVTSFLGWAELESSGRSDARHAIRLNKLLHDIQSRLELRFPERIKLESETNAYILADPQRVELALTNLILNALEYSPDDSRVSIQAHDRVLEIRDAGPGLPQEVRERIGEPFNRGSVGPYKKSGHGLGLAWVMSVAKRYDWSIQIESGAEGTSFVIEFPATDSMMNEDSFSEKF